MTNNFTYKITLLLFFSLHAIISFSQDTLKVEKNKEYTSRIEPKNIIAVDIKSAFSGFNNVSVVFKREKSTGRFVFKDQKKYWRANLDISTNTVLNKHRNDSVLINNFTVSNLSYFDESYFRGSLAIGLEKQRKIRNNLFFVYGTDLLINHYANNFSYRFLISNSSTDETNVRKITSTGFGVVPFLGINYKIRSWLTIGMETSLSILFINEKWRDIQYTANYNTNKLEEASNDLLILKKITTRYAPLRFLYVGIYF